MVTSKTIPEEIWEYLDILDIHIGVRRCGETYLIFEKRNIGWIHLATKFTIEQVNEYLRDLVIVEGEIQNAD